MAPLFQAGQHAHGIIAVGQVATGVIAIGQMATGVIAVGQVARGVVAIGQVALGIVAIGMGSVGLVYAGGLVGVGGRAGFGFILPLMPMSGGHSRIRWALAPVQLVLLCAAAWLFWYLAGVPLGNALWDPGGILR